MTSKFLKAAMRRLVASPVTNHLPLLVALVATLCGPQIFGWLFCQAENAPFIKTLGVILFKLSGSTIVAWLLVLIYDVMHFGKRIYITLLFIIISMGTTVDLYFLTNYDREFDILFIGMITGSNPGETGDFLRASVNAAVLWNMLFSLVGILGVYFATLIVNRKWRMRARTACYFIAANMLVTVVIFAIDWPLCINSSALPVKLSFHYDKLKAVPDITTEPLHLVSTAGEGESKPKNIVIVIGESMNRDHSSLYGYHLPTNPELQQLVDSGRLYPFTNVEASATHTIYAFERFMSTYSDAPGQNPDVDAPGWNHYPTITDLAHATGYFATWISNQAKAGFMDNIVSKYAGQADRQYWVNRITFYHPFAVSHDENVVGALRNAMKNDNDSLRDGFYFVHLMGSHGAFASRYPAKYAKFGEQQYSSYPESQRQLRSEYDNSILYNDHVVAGIMKTVQELSDDAIVIYFSDHGLDVFYSKPDYYDHAIPGNAESEALCMQIPFMIYTTPGFDQKRPEIVESIQAHLDSPYTTNDLIYTLMDIIGVAPAEDPGAAKSRSLLQIHR